MLRVDCARWGGTAEDLRHVALSAPHARTRERALALYEITQGSCATRVAARTGRHPQTVMGWVHAYNAQGPDTLAFRRTGGRPPFARRSLAWRLTHIPKGVKDDVFFRAHEGHEASPCEMPSITNRHGRARAIGVLN